MVLAGETLSGDAIQELRRRHRDRRSEASAPEAFAAEDVGNAYLERVTGDIKLKRKMRIAVDCGNGVPGAFAPALYRKLGCEVEELFCEVDGTFPNHHPDPSQPENLKDLIAALQEGQRRDRPGFRRRRRPPRRGHQGRQDHLPGPPVDAVRRRRAQAQSRRRDPVRREMHAQSRALDPQARRQADHVEDRPLVDQGKDEGNRRAARR